MPELIVIRGLPGAGKSTLARQLCLGFNHISGKPWNHFENDQFQVNHLGEHEYKVERIFECVKKCQESTIAALDRDENVVVSNTFVRRQHIAPYVHIAKSRGIRLTVITLEGSHGSVHDVPDDVMQRYRREWQSYG